MLSYEEKHFRITFEKDSKEVQEAIEYLSRSHKRMRVEYEDREAFLEAFIPLLLNKEKGEGLVKVNSLARVLHLTVDFMDADGGTNTLKLECIKSEILRVGRKLYPKKKK